MRLASVTASRPRRQWCRCASRKTRNEGPRPNWQSPNRGGLRHPGRGNGASRKRQGADRCQGCRVAGAIGRRKGGAATKAHAVTTARAAAVAAEAARVASAAAARQVMRELEREPVSVLISRKTQRLYVRQGFEPILESPVTILDADRPIGTHIFTAMERTNGETTMRWSVVSLEGGRPREDAIE